jgi:two-component system sensor histidine kinase/response regulator
MSFFVGMWTTISSGNVWHGEVCNRAKDGSIYWVNATIVPFFDEQGRIQQYIAIRTDITAQKQLESQIAESGRRFQSIIENLQEVVYRVDAQGRWTYLSPAWERMTGYTVEESLGRTWVEFLLPDDRDQVLADLAQHLRKGEEFFTYQTRLISRTAGAVWIENHVRLEFDAQGRVIETSGTLNDISERRDALDQLQEQLRFVNELIELVPQPIYMKNRQGRYVMVNEGVRALLWHRAGALPG